MHLLSLHAWRTPKTETENQTDNMPRIYNNTTMGFTFPLSVSFETVEEYNAQKGNPDAWFETLCAQECYQGWNAAFRENFIARIEEQTGVKREVTGYRNNDEKKPILETEGKYFARVQAMSSEDGSPVATEQQLRQWALEAASETGDLTVSPGLRGNKPAKPFYEKADAMIAAIGQPSRRKPGTTVSAESIVELWESDNSVSFSANFGEFNRDSLAKALKFDTDRRERESSLV